MAQLHIKSMQGIANSPHGVPSLLWGGSFFDRCFIFIIAYQASAGVKGKRRPAIILLAL